MASLLLLLVLACGDKDAGGDSGSAGDGGTDGAGTDTDGGTTDGGTTDGGDDTGPGTDPPDGSQDEVLLRGAIEGTIDAGDALATIALRGGLPVATTDGTFLFACLCGDDPGGGWKLAGDHDDWAGSGMSDAGGGLWWTEVAISSPVDSGYKFTDGADDWRADPWARRYRYDAFGELSLVRADAAHLERWPGVDDGVLSARTVRVWLPDGGAFTHALYAHDGQNLFDPDGILGGWRLDESLPAGVLVVALDNTADRIDEYTLVEDELHGTRYGGDSALYGALIADTVRPMMDAQYGEASVYGLMGSSLGGLVSIDLATAAPDAWDMGISLSGTMGWGSFGLHEETLPERIERLGKVDVALYIDSGGTGTTCADSDGDGVPDDDATSYDSFCENLWLRDILDAAGWTFEEDLWHWHEDGAPHSEPAWAARVWRPLELFAGL